MRGTRHESGFSLLEVLFAIILIGLAIASLVAANGSFTKTNAAGTELSTAEFLAEQIRELTVLLPVVDPENGTAMFGPEADETTLSAYDDLDDFDGFNSTTLGAPIDAQRQVLNEFAAYSQQVTVEKVNPANFEEVIFEHKNFVRVTVKVLLNTKEITSASWVRAWYEEQ